MQLDPVLLDRIQAGFTFAFHIIFPSFTIGLSAYVGTLSVLWVSLVLLAVALVVVRAG